MKILRNMMLIGVLCTMLGGCVLAFAGGDDTPHGYWSHNDSDRNLAQTVRTRLDADSQIHAAAISVHSDDGDITLQGSVNDAATLGKAVAIAATTPGVTKVICEISVLQQ